MTNEHSKEINDKIDMGCENIFDKHVETVNTKNYSFDKNNVAISSESTESILSDVNKEMKELQNNCSNHTNLLKMQDSQKYNNTFNNGEI